MTYLPRYDGHGFEVPHNVILRWRCCDCALVHDIVFVSYDEQPIGVAARVNRRATAASRRCRVKEGS